MTKDEQALGQLRRARDRRAHWIADKQREIDLLDCAIEDNITLADVSLARPHSAQRNPR